jgi:flagellar biogenesis protein FliO
MKTSRSRKSNSITGEALPLPVLADEASLSTLRSHTGLLSRAWGWIQARQVARSGTRRLRVAETVSLGEKRFVAVVQVDGRHFLLAGGPTNIALLAQLDANEAFEDVLKKTMPVPSKQPAKRKQPANLTVKAQVNTADSFEDVLQKTATARRKQPAKRKIKHNAFVGAPANAPLMAPLNATETFGDVLHKTMSAAGKQLAKQTRKQNVRATIEQTGQYA